VNFDVCYYCSRKIRRPRVLCMKRYNLFLGSCKIGRIRVALQIGIKKGPLVAGGRLRRLFVGSATGSLFPLLYVRVQAGIIYKYR